jgi:hypothetical protein
MKVGDLVYYQCQGFDSGFEQGEDGLATLISLSYSPANGKSSDTAKILLHWKGEVWDVWRLQVGLLKEKNDGCWRHCKDSSHE